MTIEDDVLAFAAREADPWRPRQAARAHGMDELDTYRACVRLVRDGKLTPHYRKGGGSRVVAYSLAADTHIVLPTILPWRTPPARSAVASGGWRRWFSWALDG